jgi:hypothetical protein
MHVVPAKEVDQLRIKMYDPNTGYVEAIRDEVYDHPRCNDPLPSSLGSQPQRSLVDWFNYVETGTTSEMQFGHDKNSIRDSGRGSMTFQDFCNLPTAKTCGMSNAEVLALRLYTTKAYRLFNDPLRSGEKHPMPMTMLFLADGLRKLRPMAVGELHADGASLWRGMKDLDVQGRFLQHGGTELACMSTSTSLEVAADYSCRGEPGAQALIIKLRVRRNEFLSYGADLRWLSAFPEERERLFPPLTYLKPTNRVQEVDIEGIHFKIIEVEPRVTN